MEHGIDKGDQPKRGPNWDKAKLELDSRKEAMALREQQTTASGVVETTSRRERKTGQEAAAYYD